MPRLDQYLSTKRSYSRSQAVKLIEAGLVKVNRKVITKASHKVDSKDQVSISRLKNTVKEIENIDIEILYEDNDCIVINKPFGILTHSKGAYNDEFSVASWLSSRVVGISGNRAGIVHRLDRATSGVMICAKTLKAQSWLQKQFSTRRTKKTYIAIVKGELEDKEAIIDLPIERNPKKPQTFRVGVNGKKAQTRYLVKKTNHGLSYLVLFPTTGRTHQLRVHLNYLGHPIVGDVFYKGPEASRMYLHAYQLELTLPNHLRQVFTAKIPSEFNKLIS